MKLRDHPKMQNPGTSIWPPVWNKLNATDPAIRGEVGVLKFVHSNLRVSLKCYLVIDHETFNYVGELVFSDRVFAEKVAILLRENIGRTIKQIGDAEIA